MMKTTVELLEDRAHLIELNSELIDKVEKDDRLLTEDEQGKFDRRQTDADTLEKKIEQRQEHERRVEVSDKMGETLKRPGRRVTEPWACGGGEPPEPDDDRWNRTQQRTAAPRGTQWRDKTGHEVRVLRRGESFGRSSGTPLSFGRWFVAQHRGCWDGAKTEKRAMAEIQNITGGMLVPDILTSGIVDLSRPMSALGRTDMRTVPMTSDNMSLAKITEDVTIDSGKAENESFTDSDVTLTRINLYTETFGGVIQVSNELLADAPNVADIIDRSMAGALAVAIDAKGLGVILDDAAISETTAVAGIEWEDLLTAVEAIELANAQPESYILNPAIVRDLRSLVSGDGTNSAKLWKGPPPGVDKLTQLSTTGIALAKMVVGSFGSFFMGLREGMHIDVSASAGSSFEQNAIKIRVVWRGAFAVGRAGDFHRLVGITS